jgi:hypothetical protein
MNQASRGGLIFRGNVGGLKSNSLGPLTSAAKTIALPYLDTAMVQ